MRERGRRRHKRSFWSDCNTTKKHCFHFARSLYRHRVKIHCFWLGLEAAVSIAASKLCQDFFDEKKSFCFEKFDKFKMFQRGKLEMSVSLCFFLQLINCEQYNVMLRLISNGLFVPHLTNFKID